MTVGQVTITTSPTLIVAGNPNRSGLTMYNMSTDTTVYWSNLNNVTATSGFPMLAQDYLEDESTTDSIYGIVLSGSAVVAYIES